ncbi:hypothetical protein E8E14_013314 [Neopestalotiopsis sp. 37M]|nr:hypothetical protein E8E14_013314 [Neopestalotiopsis sp. 37M]
MTGETLKRLEGSRGKFEAFTFDASGQYLAAVCSSGDTIYIWNTNTAEVSMKLKGHKGKIDLLAFSPNGKQLVSSSGSHWGHSEESICLWNLETGKVLWRQEVYMLPFRPIRPSSDEQQQTSASDGTMFRPWDVSTGQVQRLRGHTYVIRSEAFSLNGYYLICVSEDSTVSLWHAATDDDPQIIAEIANLVTSVAFRPGAQQHISWSGNLPVRLWDPASGNTFWTFPWKSFQENLIRFRKLELNSSNCAESGFFFDTDTNWLSFNGRRLVWLPHEFRPELSAVHGNRIAIGSQSGAVFILEAHPNELIATGQIQ